MDWDVFISHAWEDKESFVRPLAEALQARGLRVWYDEFTITVGDSLRRSIDRGLANSRYGIVVLSPSFFSKEWPQKELAGLVAREVNGEKVILPVWHNITIEQVRKYSPILADRVAAYSSKGLGNVIGELLRVIQNSASVEKPHLGLDTEKDQSQEIWLEVEPELTEHQAKIAMQASLATPDEDLTEQAIELVRQLDEVTISLLQRKFNIGYSRAVQLMEQLEKRSIVGPKESELKPRLVLADDVLIDQAIELVRSQDRASISFLQRKLIIGYTRAARLMIQLERRNIVGPDEGIGKFHRVLIRQNENETHVQAEIEKAGRETDEQTTKQILVLSLQLTEAESQNNWNKVIELGEHILKLDANHQPTRSKTAWAYHSRSADSYDFNKEYNSAIAGYSRAIELDPIWQHYAARGYDYYLKGDYRHTIDDCSRAISIAPSESADNYYCRGMSFKLLGNLQSARYDLRRAADMGHSDAQTELAKL